MIQIAEKLSQLLVSSDGLKCVDISDIIAGRHEDEALAVLEALSAALSRSSASLVELNVSENALGSKGVLACRSLLQHRAYLERLYFCNNGLSAEACELIRSILMEGNGCPALKVLHFYNNMSGDGGG